MTGEEAALSPGAELRRVDAAPSFALSRWLFLRLLGAVYLVAFASLAVQLAGLVGEHGLLPAAPFLEWAHSIYGREAYRLLPTLFWFGAGDTVALCPNNGSPGNSVCGIEGV